MCEVGRAPKSRDTAARLALSSVPATRRLYPSRACQNLSQGLYTSTFTCLCCTRLPSVPLAIPIGRFVAIRRSPSAPTTTRTVSRALLIVQ